MMGSVLAGAVGRALVAVGLDVGDVMLVSSSGAIYEVARFELPRMPGVIVAPTVGGTDLPEAWYQTNEFTRLVAERIGGRQALLYAPALPAAELFQTLQTDQAIQMVLNLWPHARCHLNPLGTRRIDVNPEYDLHSRHISAADDGWSVHRSRVTREELDG
jgi:DNA-binding transcriptional regulator LsrR (DeoR family)